MSQCSWSVSVFCNGTLLSIFNENCFIVAVFKAYFCWIVSVLFIFILISDLLILLANLWLRCVIRYCDTQYCSHVSTLPVSIQYVYFDLIFKWTTKPKLFSVMLYCQHTCIIWLKLQVVYCTVSLKIPPTVGHISRPIFLTNTIKCYTETELEKLVSTMTRLGIEPRTSDRERWQQRANHSTTVLCKATVTKVTCVTCSGNTLLQLLPTPMLLTEEMACKEYKQYGANFK